VADGALRALAPQTLAAEWAAATRRSGRFRPVSMRPMLVDRARVVTTEPIPEAWPFTLPCVRQLCTEGLAFDAPLTIFIGENGSGKSTLIEAIAEAYGWDVRGGHGNRRYATGQARSTLGSLLRLQHGLAPVKGGDGFFLRAETAYSMLHAMSDYGVRGYGDRHAARVSHGESYLQVLEGRFDKPGLYLLDEPESPLSFESCLVLMRILHDTIANGSQVICATHSPVLAAMPGAQLLEIGDEGMRPVEWAHLAMVDHWRGFLGNPATYLRHVLA
jgi:predicted ATPase